MKCRIYVYKKDIKSNFTVRRKEEEIGDSDKIEDYEEFLSLIGIDKEDIRPMLEVNNLRYLYTIKINGVLSQFKTQLKSGDEVEILTAKTPQIHEEWLELVKTAKAKLA